MHKYALARCFAVFFYYVIVVLLNSGCSNNSVSQSWSSNDHAKDDKAFYSGLLIIGIGETEYERHLYENAMVNALTALSVMAEPAYPLISSNAAVNRDRVSLISQEKAIDAVMVIHKLAVDQRDAVTASEPSLANLPEFADESYAALYSYYSQVNNAVHNLNYQAEQEQYMIETNLYDIESEELIWSARSQVFPVSGLGATASDVYRDIIMTQTRNLAANLKTRNLIK